MRKTCCYSSKQDLPCIYFIAKDVYLYIGETQKFICNRWSAHLQKNGSFSKQLKRKDEEALLADQKISFLSFHLSELEERCEKWEWKKVTQGIEHLVHLKVDQSSKITSRFQTISNTIRTAPLHSKYDWIEELSDNIVKAIENEFDFFCQSELDIVEPSFTRR